MSKSKAGYLVKRKPVFVIGPSIAYIPLTRGYWATVDAADAEMLAQWNWCLHDPGRGPKYAKHATDVDGKTVTVKMHRLLLGLTDKQILADHVNGNGVDNRRGLRNADRSQNLFNYPGQAHAKFGLKGVSNHSSGLIRARIVARGKRYELGYFRSPKRAAEAYKVAAAQLHGEFACTSR